MGRVPHLLLLPAFLFCGCLGHKDAAKVLDPLLLAEGSKHERARHPDGFALGEYVVSKKRLKRRPSGSAGTSSTPDQPTSPGEVLELDAEVTRGSTVWSVRCEAKRTPTASADYGAVLDESRDAVSIECDLWTQSGERWTFTSQGSLGSNLGGKLDSTTTKVYGGALEVEVLMWRRRFNRIRRHLPQPVAQVKAGRKAVAAMVLARPEEAWIAKDAPEELRDPAMATLAALRLLPMGFEG